MIEGVPFTGPFQLTARIDADGNATGDADDLPATAGDLPGRGAEGELARPARKTSRS